MRIYTYGALSFFAGFVLMMFEILSSRIIAPIVGASLYSWAAVIGVTLIGLTLGAVIGGKIADRPSHSLALPYLMLGSAVTLALVPLISELVAHIQPFQNVPFFICVIACILFLPATLILGMLQPLIVKAAVSTVATLGSVYGVLSGAWSLGSILGVFCAGFFAIPLFGVSGIVYGLACALVLIAVMYLLRVHHSNMSVWYVLATIGIIIVSIYGLHSIRQGNTPLVFEGDTPYFHARVIDIDLPGLGVSRGLFLDADLHSISIPGIAPNVYTNETALLPLLVPAPKRILIIGGGAYTLPRAVALMYPKAQVDVVELDPEVVSIAQTYFGALPSNVHTTVGDARLFLRTNTDTYDIVIGDAYSSFVSVPWYLLTSEFTQSINAHLSSSGIYMLNFLASRDSVSAPYVSSVVQTFLKQIPAAFSLAFSNDPHEAQNITLIGFHTPPAYDSDAFQNAIHHLGPYAPLAQYVIDPHTLITPGAGVTLTDNYAPIEALLAPFVSSYFPESEKVEQQFFYAKK